MKPSDTSTRAEHLRTVHLQALSLVKGLEALTAEEPPEQLPFLLDLIVQVQEVVKFASKDLTPPASETPSASTPEQLRAFGKLLRDKRNAGGPQSHPARAPDQALRCDDKIPGNCASSTEPIDPDSAHQCGRAQARLERLSWCWPSAC